MKTNTLKWIVIVLMLAGNFSSCTMNDSMDNVGTAQYDFYYSSDGEKISLKIRKDRVILKAISEDEAKTLSMQACFIMAYYVSDDWVIAAIDTSKMGLDELMQRQDVVDGTYALEGDDGTLYMPTYQIFVKFKEGQSPKKVFDDVDLSKNVETIGLFIENAEIYRITLNVKLGDILQICRNLFESGWCEFAEPSFIRLLKNPLPIP